MAWWRREPGAATTAEAPGPTPSRRLDRGFFDAYPRFFETSQTSAQPWRLNLRHEAIFGDNAEVFPGARVLDIASHDGRWSLGAVKAGASHVIGIEARPELTAFAGESLAAYGAPSGAFEFRVGDVFKVLHETGVDVDVVLCLGFFYHTLRYPELWSLMARTGARTIVMDTMVTPGDQPVIRVTHEPFTREGNAVPDDYSSGDRVLTGRPTVAALEVMASVYGFSLEAETDWPRLLADNPTATGIGDYREGRRTTLRFVGR